MLLEKPENLLELPVKKLLIQSSLASLISRSQAMFGVWKQMLMLFAKKLGNNVRYDLTWPRIGSEVQVVPPAGNICDI